MICVSLLQIFSSRDVQDQLSKIQNLLNDTNSAWEKRCDAVCTDYLHFSVNQPVSEFIISEHFKTKFEWYLD